MSSKIVVFCLILLVAALTWAKKSNPNYMMHKVVAGESLYRIAQKNKVTVEEILKSNPGVTAASLKPGMMLRIPVKNVPAGNKPGETLPNTSSKQQNHIVLAKETLYSISKKYGVTVEEIKKWNDLKDTDLKTGMVLVIHPQKNDTGKAPDKENVPKPVSPQPTATQPTKPQQPVTLPGQEELPTDVQTDGENLSLSALIKQFNSQQKTGSPQTVKGTADLMASSTPQASNTYFAMHKTAPIGTILKIKNLENSKITYAKVIGKLPDLEENKNVMVRVSMGVAKAIQMGYGKVYVEMNFAQ